ncbi:hypothetical protein, partial [Pseudoalteromonas rhizosphaerae]|uniref:hypothetical protein n=1 Tax=Pseudoalteromonas rhizosphaerae TaxID=2518973 RepID=UPI00384DE080
MHNILRAVTPNPIHKARFNTLVAAVKSLLHCQQCTLTSIARYLNSKTTENMILNVLTDGSVKLALCPLSGKHVQLLAPLSKSTKTIYFNAQTDPAKCKRLAKCTCQSLVKMIKLFPNFNEEIAMRKTR